MTQLTENKSPMSFLIDTQRGPWALHQNSAKEAKQLVGINGLRLAFPCVAEAANRFAQADRKIDNRLQPLSFGGGEMIGVREQKFRVAEYARQRIVNFVAEDLAKIFRKL